jgi:hypothetical protein
MTRLGLAFVPEPAPRRARRQNQAAGSGPLNSSTYTARLLWIARSRGRRQKRS